MKIQWRNNNVHECKDRLSDLCDYLLIHILSFLESKKAVQTCILSTRWRNLWKQLPFLLLYSLHSNTLPRLTEFASQFLSLRDGSTSLFVLQFYNFSDDIMEPHVLDTILQYAVSHNIHRLDIYVKCDIQHFPSCLFSCDTLTSLRFYVAHIRYDKLKIIFPNSLNLPSLTSLHLGFVAFHGGLELFLAYPRLKSLEIAHFEILGEENLFISSTTLEKLTIELCFKPKNDRKIELFTPSLCAFAFIGTPFQILCGSPLSFVKHIEIDADMWWNYADAPSILLRWLLEISDIESLIVCSNTLQVYLNRICTYVSEYYSNLLQNVKFGWLAFCFNKRASQDYFCH
jgi:hypothetical protein